MFSVTAIVGLSGSGSALGVSAARAAALRIRTPKTSSHRVKLFFAFNRLLLYGSALSAQAES